jgi:hypothetical protein
MACCFMSLLYSQCYCVSIYIFKLVYNGQDIPFTLLRFDEWNDLFDTEYECECQIKEYGNPVNRYIILPIYDIEYSNS